MHIAWMSFTVAAVERNGFTFVSISIILQLLLTINQSAVNKCNKCLQPSEDSKTCVSINLQPHQGVSYALLLCMTSSWYKITTHIYTHIRQICNNSIFCLFFQSFIIHVLSLKYIMVQRLLIAVLLHLSPLI